MGFAQRSHRVEPRRAACPHETRDDGDCGQHDRRPHKRSGIARRASAALREGASPATGADWHQAPGGSRFPVCEVRPGTTQPHRGRCSRESAPARRVLQPALLGGRGRYVWAVNRQDLQCRTRSSDAQTSASSPHDADFGALFGGHERCHHRDDATIGSRAANGPRRHFEGACKSRGGRAGIGPVRRPRTTINLDGTRRYIGVVVTRCVGHIPDRRPHQ